MWVTYVIASRVDSPKKSPSEQKGKKFIKF